MSTEEKKVENEQVDENIDYGSFLTTSAEDVQTDDFEESSADPDYYRPTVAHKEAKDRIYKGRGRFVPNVNDDTPNRSMQKISKYIFCLPTLDGEGKFYVDVPEGEAAKKNIVTQAFFALREHESVTYQQMAKEHFSRKRYHWMLYLPMKDDQEPDVVGKVKIFRFGKKINDKIEYESKADPSTGKKDEIAVHDPFNGKDLILHINEITNDRGQKMTSYDQSSFDNVSSISLDGGETRLGNTKEDMKTIYNFLKENSPDLSKAAHKPWTEEEEEKIIKVVQQLVDDDMLFNQIYKKAYGRNFFSNPVTKSENTANRQQKVSKQEEKNDTVEFEKDDQPVVKNDEKQEVDIKNDEKTTADIKNEVIEKDKPKVDDGVVEIDVDFEEDN